MFRRSFLKRKKELKRSKPMKKSGLKRKNDTRKVKGTIFARGLECSQSQRGTKILKDLCWKLFSRYIRKRDAIHDSGTLGEAKCCTCGKMQPIERLQGGHFIAQRRNSILFHRQNVHAQCYGCNVMGYGQPKKYRAFMLENYGQDVIDRLIEENQKEVHLNVPKLIHIYRRVCTLLLAMDPCDTLITEEIRHKHWNPETDQEICGINVGDVQ